MSRPRIPPVEGVNASLARRRQGATCISLPKESLMSINLSDIPNAVADYLNTHVESISRRWSRTCPAASNRAKAPPSR